MQSALKAHPLTLAVCGALTFMAGDARAQGFDPNSAAVRQAYVGVVTLEKYDAALVGLGTLVNQVLQSNQNGNPTIILPPGSASAYLLLSGNVNDAFKLIQHAPPAPGSGFNLPITPPVSTIHAASDGDLGVPGAFVSLNATILQNLASFNTARNFTIGADSATIDTNGFNFGISGNINSIGVLTKDGAGTLALTGNNFWNYQPRVMNGVLEGNTNSLRTSITNNATVRFNQAFDGSYGGVISTISNGNFEKTGSGKLTITAGQAYGGATSILAGTLALTGSGSLGNTSGLNIANGATFDIADSAILTHTVGALSGEGNVLLGGNFVSSKSDGNSTFSGTISGHGQFSKASSGILTLTGVNTYTGTTNILNGTLALAGAGKLNSSSAVQIEQGTFDISGANGAREVGTIGGNGNIHLGANTLTVGGHATSNTYTGSISGSGGLTKTGNSSLTLTGANSYTGTTTIAQGSLGARVQSISANVVNNGALILSEDGNATYAGAISGSGSVTKSGSGNLTLTGDHSYSGETTINGGTLALAGHGRLNPTSNLYLWGGAFDISAANGDRAIDTVFGLGAIRLGNNTLTVGGNNSSSSFLSGNISGSGGLTKTGSGTLGLSGLNTYTGVTTVNEGNLTAKPYSISDRVINNATLTLTEDKGVTTPFVSVHSGTIGGSGRLIKDGDGLIWLRGRNSYTGGTTVNSGYLIGNTDSLQGNITNNAALAFYQIDNGTYAGNLSGSGTLLQYGPGVLTLTGNNTYTGGTAFSGTLRVDRDANLGAASGAVVIAAGTLQIGADITTARNITIAPSGGTFDTNGYQLNLTGNIAGNGSLSKVGTGTLALNGVNKLTGTTTVTAGRLEVNGLTTGNITVAAGGELGGVGLFDGNVEIRGLWSRGNNTGTTEILGAARFEPGSAFVVKTNAAGESDRLSLPPALILAGIGAPPPPPQKVILNGGTVEVRAESGNYRRETRYNIISAFGGVTGQFNGVTSNLAFLNPSLNYDPNNVYLTLTRNDLSYTAVAQNPNQFAIAQSLNRMASGASGDGANVAAALDGLSAQQARAAFDSIGGAGRALMPQSLNVNQRSINQNLVARLSLANSENTLAPATGIAGRDVQLVFDESTRSDAAPVYAQIGVPSSTGFRANMADTSKGLWLRGYGGSGRLDGDASAPGAKYHYGGTLLGYDHQFGNATAGVFAGYAEPRYTQDFSMSSAKAKTWQVGAYGRVVSGAWHVDGVASYGRSDTDTSRLVNVGSLNRVASGSFNGDAWSAHVETGYTLKADSFEVQPLAALSWVRQNQDAYSETGAGALNLILPNQSQDSLRSSLGVRTLHPFSAAGMQWVFETRAAWSHEFKSTRGVNARLAGDPAAGVFTVSSPDVPRDSAVLGVGIAAQASRNMRLYADVNTELNGASRAYTLSAGVRYQW